VREKSNDSKDSPKRRKGCFLLKKAGCRPQKPVGNLLCASDISLRWYTLGEHMAKRMDISCIPFTVPTSLEGKASLLCRNEQNGVLRLPQCCCVGATAHIWDETHHSPGQSMRLRVQSCLVSGPHLSTASPVSLEAPDHKSHRPQPGAPMGLQEWLHQEHGLRISFILKKLQDSEPLTIPLWASVSL
jgi:hypothetical protein